MFVKIASSKGAELFHVTSFSYTPKADVVENATEIAISMELMTGRAIRTDLRTSKNHSNFSVFVMNDAGRTVDSYNW